MTDVMGNISVYNGQTLKPQPEIVLNGIHRKGSRCQTIAMHPSNEFFATGGNDSIIAFWDFEEFLCSGTIADNSFPVRQLSFSPCGTFLAGICLDDRIENAKKYVVEVFDTD